MAATSFRLPDDLLRELDRWAKQEHTDRSTVLKQAVDRGLRAMALDRAIATYEKGGWTAMRAAREAGVPLWEFLDELQRRGKWFLTDEDLLREQFAERP